MYFQIYFLPDDRCKLKSEFSVLIKKRQNLLHFLQGVIRIRYLINQSSIPFNCSALCEWTRGKVFAGYETSFSANQGS